MTQQAQRPTPTIRAATGSRLEALAAAYAEAKPAADAAAERLQEIKDAIKVELTNAAPGETRVDLASAVLDKPLALRAKTSWRLDTKRFKAEEPVTYVKYAYRSTSWELREGSS